MQKLPSVLDQCMLACISDSSCSRAETLHRRHLREAKARLHEMVAFLHAWGSAGLLNKMAERNNTAQFWCSPGDSDDSIDHKTYVACFLDKLCFKVTGGRACCWCIVAMCYHHVPCIMPLFWCDHDRRMDACRLRATHLHSSEVTGRNAPLLPMSVRLHSCSHAIAILYSCKHSIAVPSTCMPMVIPDFKIVCTTPSKAEPFGFSQTAWAQSCMECKEALWRAAISSPQNVSDKGHSAA